MIIVYTTEEKKADAGREEAKNIKTMVFRGEKLLGP